MEKEKYIEEIKSNIQKFGYHVTYVIADISPSFAYTIGLSQTFNFELVIAGGAFYNRAEKETIITSIADKIIETDNKIPQSINLGELGVFSLSLVDESWSKLFLLGVYDILKKETVVALGIVPDQNHFTLDIPKMSVPFNVNNEPVWQWMAKEWKYNVSKESTVGTDLDALKGKAITEVTRWEDDYWEMYHGDGNEMPKDQIRVVSIGTMLGIDPSLIAAFDVPLEKGLYRESADDEWKKWRW
ncbi:DUF4262 domain-containing protein [Chitinophaga sp. LS1]|uniref:DUF4262 domain-containing protein n=1 Tax=Chitinophaga sp. LS1 TaxID=3051176 RepID=UPI002AAC1BEF|nr:DUF4262 domain-containing protein [Chitinophaga sp. LS1]WPV69685.1 DUF4262 domain-containing protein [Chitinophaga sp. LS1]